MSVRIQHEQEVWALIRELETVKNGNRVLDGRVWKACGGRVERTPAIRPALEYDRWIMDDKGADLDSSSFVRWPVNATNFTTDVQCALDLVPDNYDYLLGHTNGGVTIHAQIGGTENQSFAETLPLAICAANLKARIQDGH